MREKSIIDAFLPHITIMWCDSETASLPGSYRESKMEISETTFTQEQIRKLHAEYLKNNPSIELEFSSFLRGNYNPSTRPRRYVESDTMRYIL